MSIIHLVSLSGGKDSTATAILALEQHGTAACRFVMADTGNEHESTLEYALDYLPGALGVKVEVVRADFSDEFATKRANLARIAAGAPESSVYGKRKFKYHWTAETAQQALELLHPTGNPYLDLCMVRGERAEPVNPASVRFKAQEATAVSCAGCLFERSYGVCSTAAALAVANGQPDCDDRSQADKTYIYVLDKSDPRQMDLISASDATELIKGT